MSTQPSTGSSPEDLAALAGELSGHNGPGVAAEELIRCAAGDRRLLESARNLVAGRLHASVDDWSATGALTLLNRALATLPRQDPLDWRVRWSQRFRMP